MSDDQKPPGNCGNEWTDAADLFAAGRWQRPRKQCHCPHPHRQHSNAQLQAFSKELRRALAGRELLVSTDLRQTSRCAIQLADMQGAATRTQLSQLRQKLAQGLLWLGIA